MASKTAEGIYPVPPQKPDVNLYIHVYNKYMTANFDSRCNDAGLISRGSIHNLSAGQRSYPKVCVSD